MFGLPDLPLLLRHPEPVAHLVVAQYEQALVFEAEMGIEVLRVLFPKGMDANEYALEVQPASKSLGVGIRAAEWMGSGPPPSAEPAESVLLCTDLHAGNVLRAAREPWLVIDPKPYFGDRTYDAMQHMLNCTERLTRGPRRFAQRMADLLDLAARNGVDTTGWADETVMHLGTHAVTGQGTDPDSTR